MEESHWRIKEVPEGMTCFTYLIRNRLNGLKYIGRKNFYRKKTRPPLKGKSRRRIEYQESDWKTYTGSCDALNMDIELLGKDKFTFEILQCFENKTHCNYHELELQVKFDVLRRADFYNANIGRRYYKNKIAENFVQTL